MSLAIDLLIICGIIKELTNYQASNFVVQVVTLLSHYIARASL